MKKLLLILLLVAYTVTAQTDGFSYQSVIIDPAVQEVPGVDLKGNILINETIEVRFTIIDASGSAEYREVQTARTDPYGMFSAVVGTGAADFGDFKRIVWEGTPKQLSVEIKLQGSNFKLQENKGLLFIPYAFHRDLLVTKTLDVSGNTIFKSNLIVDGQTFLNNDMFVNNQSETFLSGSLRVDGATVLNDSLTVANNSYTYLSGELKVDKETLLKDSLQVNRNARLKSELQVAQQTALGNGLNVSNQSPVLFTGNLDVGGETNTYSTIHINNESNLAVSGDLFVQGTTVFNQDLTVNGTTNLNNNLNVNNAFPTVFSGTLVTAGASRLETTLVVEANTNLEGAFNVNAQSPTLLSGNLAVGGITNFNNSLSVNNLSPTDLSGDLTVGGAAIFNEDVTIDGVTNLNNTLFVNNGATTQFSGILGVDQATLFLATLDVMGATNLQNTITVNNNSLTNLSGTLVVDGVTSFKNSLLVANNSATFLSGVLAVEETSILNNNLNVLNAAATNFSGSLFVDDGTKILNNLSVLNGSPTVLSGSITVDGASMVNNTLRVNNGMATNLTGTLDLTGETNFQNALNVTNASSTALSGTLTVGGVTSLNNTLDVTGFTLINNDLTLGATNTSSLLGGISATDLTISNEQLSAIAIFENTNTANGDGILIKLGRTHGAYNGPAGTNNPGDYLQINNQFLTVYQSQIQTIGNLLATTDPNGTSINVNDIVDLVPANLVAGQFGSIGNNIIGVINDKLGLPFDFPGFTIPEFTIVPAVTVFPGSNTLCSGQYCFNPCTFFNCTICIPPIEFCVPALPAIVIPEIAFPATQIVPQINNIIPGIPQGLPEISNANILTIPNVTATTVSNSMSKENAFISFQDKEARQTGAIVAQSTADFRDNTVLDPVYVINVLAGFVGVDLVEGLIAGGVEMSNLIDAYNKLGVSFESGHGDYAEWLPREKTSEYLTAGDIVAVRGGKISKDLVGFEQILVVSHNPIVLGNTPEKEITPYGNPVAFLGQVPVKVLGPVSQGDFIVADTVIAGYGRAISLEDMKPVDYRLAVGRSWESNNNEGPKMVNIVMGIHNSTIAKDVDFIEQQQNRLDVKIETLEEQLGRISEKLQKTSANQLKLDYATTIKQ
jgi:hypothetical protein